MFSPAGTAGADLLAAAGGWIGAEPLPLMPPNRSANGSLEATAAAVAAAATTARSLLLLVLLGARPSAPPEAEPDIAGGSDGLEALCGKQAADIDGGVGIQVAI